ncbi:RcpC/CpaB family pilus assembly protein [Streptomyces sp. NRRL WC-3549]|uniref:RcpC/CpaB family pilus assembly protein n=1 Tax=Streptomyces sp. NRRL WC-3549 TaxID=1463925 RepID=UPI0004CBBD11|nr:RcpC/CpaB family pilus assembly protein [Streptomyces sp. NRRL WC-3549]
MFPSVPETRPAPPAPCGMPSFEPLRVRGGGGGRLRRALRRQRRATAAGFALSCVVFAVSGLGGSGPAGAGPPAPPDGRVTAAAGARPVAEREREGRPGGLVSAPVRIADAATVSLLRPGDHVDVIAAREGAAEARVVAQDVRVAEVPGRRSGGSGPDFAALEELDGGPGRGGDGALVVLAVERGTATALAGAGTSGRLVVAVSRGH